MMPDNERRQHSRREWEVELEYAINILDYFEFKKLNLTCHTLNISAGGLCIETYYPIEPGHVLRFGKNMNGIAKWSMKFDNAYRVGIKFI